jgi:hypothetical protein
VQKVRTANNYEAWTEDKCFEMTKACPRTSEVFLKRSQYCSVSDRYYNTAEIK